MPGRLESESHGRPHTTENIPKRTPTQTHTHCQLFVTDVVVDYCRFLSVCCANTILSLSCFIKLSVKHTGKQRVALKCSFKFPDRGTWWCLHKTKLHASPQVCRLQTQTVRSRTHWTADRPSHTFFNTVRYVAPHHNTVSQRTHM